MERLKRELTWFLNNRIYVVTLIFVAICGHGYSIVTPIVGIDDTATGLYFDDGLAVVMGRWTLFLVNKFLRIAEFSPFIMEFIGAVLLCIGATLFCVLLRRLLGDRVGTIGYTVYACVFVTNPIISEVNVYYLHNGVDLAYILAALSLWCYLDATATAGWRRACGLCGSMLFIWLSAGCYESMMIVYIFGILFMLLLRGMTEEADMTFAYLIRNLAMAAGVLIGAVLLRMVTVPVLTALFHLEDVVGIMSYRTIAESLAFFRPGGWAEFVMLIKRYWLVYIVNAFVYLPITGYVMAAIIVGVATILFAIRQKKVCYLLVLPGMLITPFLLTIIEAKPTAYRSCQHIPFFVACGFILLYWAAASIKSKGIAQGICFLFSFVFIFNQAAGLNRAFYVDYQKYENTKEVLLGIAKEVETEYGHDIPVVFAGHYSTPYEIAKDSYVPYGSWQYRCVAAVSDLVDPHLKEKYFTPYGYSFVGEANNPFILWGMTAFDGTNKQIMNFLEMHGHSFVLVTDEAILANAREFAQDMPGWPAEGSITLQDGYVLVNIQ